MNNGIYLGITTSEKETGIALVKDNQVLFEKIDENGCRHNETLFVDLAEAFKLLNISVKQLAGIGVVIGPGMFSSLRVGIACAKGLAVVNNIPIKGFNTLDALVFSLPKTIIAEQRIIVPTIDVKRGEVYFQVYQGTQPMSKPQIAKPEIMALKIPANAILLGSGISQYFELVQSTAKTHFEVYQLFHPLPSAIARRAAECIAQNDITDIERLVPFYVR
ncbi:MAG: tRNA (adenosine(37)-N6)-threonylcarbamoyltransferase complex dimerization subunit type 1 TsaB [candidate division WOR-3 bacterium]